MWLSTEKRIHQRLKLENEISRPFNDAKTVFLPNFIKQKFNTLMDFGRTFHRNVSKSKHKIKKPIKLQDFRKVTAAVSLCGHHQISSGHSTFQSNAHSNRQTLHISFGNREMRKSENNSIQPQIIDRSRYTSASFAFIRRRGEEDWS